MNALTKQLYDALKKVTSDFEWESDDEHEAWVIQRDNAITAYETIYPPAPVGYRLLDDGEMMIAGDLVLTHQGKWESVTEFEEWSPSFRPMARKIV